MDSVMLYQLCGIDHLVNQTRGRGTGREPSQESMNVAAADTVYADTRCLIFL